MDTVWWFHTALNSASEHLDTASKEYNSYMPRTLPCPRGGDDAVDRMLQVTLRTIREMHIVLEQALYQHSAKLSRAAEQYRETEDGNTDLICNILDQLEAPNWATPPKTEAPILSSDKNNLAKSANFTLKSLPGATVPTPAARAALSPCIWNFINDGDFYGLYQLGTELYEFAEQSNGLVEHLAGYIESLCGDTGDWHGYAANAFRYSFGGDAIIISGLARSASAIASVTDNLGVGLSQLEWNFEKAVHWGLSNGLLEIVTSNPATALNAWSTQNFGPSGGYLTLTANGRDNDISTQMTVLWDHAHNAARALQNRTAAQLTVLCAPISEALDWYTTKDGQQFEREYGGPLRSDQVTGDTTGIERLQKEFKSAAGSAGITGSQITAALKQLNTLGGDAASMGNVIAGLGGAEALAKHFESGNKLLSSIGTVLADLGTAAPALAILE